MKKNLAHLLRYDLVQLTLNRPGFLQIGMAGGGGGGGRFCPLCNFCLGGPIDLKFGM